MEWIIGKVIFIKNIVNIIVGVDSSIAGIVARKDDTSSKLSERIDQWFIMS